MPTIKLTSGSYTRYEEGRTRKRYKRGDIIHDVPEPMTKVLRCEVIGAPKPSLDELRAQAIALGVEVKPQWNAVKLLAEIAAHAKP